jgi:WD repeat-containing protein 70
MISGSADYVLKIWDLTTMNTKLKSFREFKPFNGHPLRALSFSPDGQNFLCCCGNN